jgi:subtilase family serine protease
LPSGKSASSKTVLYTAFAAITLFFAVPLCGQQRQALPTRISAPAGIKAVGRLPQSQPLSLAITLKLRNQEELQSLLHDLYDPANPNYRHFLTVEQFTARFGPTTDDFERVEAFARSNGLEITHETPNRLVLDVSGKVSDVERAFHVTMQVYQHPTEPRTFYAPDVEPSVDTSLAIQGVSGLTTLSPPRPASLHVSHAAHRARASEAGSGSGPDGALFGSDIRAAYAPGVTLNGAGQAVGILELSPYSAYNLSDIQTYFNTEKQPLNVPIVNVLLDGISGVCALGCDDLEEGIDIEMAISMAPNLSALIVYEGNSPIDILNQMAADDIAKQLSASLVWGGDASTTDPIFEEFAAQGQNLFASSGDGGAFSPPDCASNCFFSVFPASDPYVTAVGGTELTTSGPGGAWQSEITWPESGGGINGEGFVIPSYQAPVINSLNQGSTTLRNIPDVAANAYGTFVCALDTCFYGGSGTSVSAPIWAGFLALANQQANGTSIGLVNPTLYPIAQGADYGSDFHDITQGNNFSIYSPSLYSAVTGYDLVTGLGTPAGQGLITALAPTQTGANFAIVASPATLSVVQGSQGTSTITVQAENGFTGAVNLRATVLGLPTGVTASLSQASVTGAASSTLTVSTTGSTSAPNIFVVVSGTSGALTQTVYIPVTVLLPNLVETAVSAPPASVNAGAVFSVTDTAQNIGQAPAGSSVTRYYLSDRTTKTSTSYLLSGTRAVPSLAIGATSSGTVSVTVPSGVWPNTPYYLLACADDTGTVGQASSSCFASTTTTVFIQPQAPTITTLAVSSRGSAVTSVASNSVVTLTATVVDGGASVETGQVNFCDASASSCTGIHLLGTAQLTSTGTATLSFVPGIGTHSYKAVFLGTVSTQASSSTASPLSVSGKFQSATKIAQSGNPGNYTLTAAVAAYMNPGAAPSPTGTVSFLDTSNGNSILGTANLVAGTPGLNWFNSQSPAAGNGPNSVAIGDFNGDGVPDLAVANWYGTTVTILLGNGDGTFTAAATSPEIPSPTSVTVGDFNGDGKADLAVTCGNFNFVEIFLGNGDGTFTPKTTIPTGEVPWRVAIADFNGDGIPDLAVVNSSNTVTVLLGNGDGTFTLADNPEAGEGPDSIAVGDFNGDGKPDLAVTSSGQSTDNWAGAVTILLGNGDGTFTKGAVIPATVDPPEAVAAGDFNGDGKLDLAVTRWFSNTLTILLGNGDGTFTATASSPATGAGPDSIVVADFNGDGKPDLAVSNEGAVFNVSSNVTVLLGNGDGTFSPAAVNPPAGVYPESIASADFNGDGIPDIAVANYNYGDSGSVTALLTQVQLGTATINGISPVGTGIHQVDASYAGDSNYSPSISGSTSLTVTPGFTVIGTAVTVTPGATTGNQSTITLTPSGGFTGSVAFTASITTGPAGAQDAPTFSFGSTTPVSITGTSAGTATLTISTTAASTAALARPRRPAIPWYAAATTALACVLLFGIPAQRRRWSTMLGMLALLVALTGGALACGGGANNGGGGGGGTSNPGTTAGTYTITVTGTSGAITASAAVQLTVQ